MIQLRNAKLKFCMLDDDKRLFIQVENYVI